MILLSINERMQAARIERGKIPATLEAVCEAAYTDKATEVENPPDGAAIEHGS